MPSVVASVALAIGGYAVGTFPTAVLVGRRRGFDPTTEGSGNPGASNVTRVGGKRAGAVVLLGDLGKGLLAAGSARLLVDDPAVWWLVGAAAVAGHIWPVTRRFRGGKGVATAAGVVLVCQPILALVAAVLFGLGLRVGGRAAVGSLVATGSVPIGLAVLQRPAPEIAIAVAVAVAIAIRHRTNVAEFVDERRAGRARPGDTG